MLLLATTALENEFGRSPDNSRCMAEMPVAPATSANAKPRQRCADEVGMPLRDCRAATCSGITPVRGPCQQTTLPVASEEIRGRTLMKHPPRFVFTAYIQADARPRHAGRPWA
jgi:hypothetical protein